MSGEIIGDAVLAISRDLHGSMNDNPKHPKQSSS